MPEKRLTSEQRRAQIIETASNLFAKDGYEGTKTKAIADACKINESLIYAYFGTKEGLYNATFAYLLKRLGQTFARQLEASKDGFDGLLSSHVEKIRAIYSNPELAVGAIRDACSTRGNQYQTDLNLHALNLTMDFFGELAARGQASDQFRNDIDSEAIACWVQGYLFFILHVAVCGLQDRVPQDMAELHLENLLRVLKPSGDNA